MVAYTDKRLFSILEYSKGIFTVHYRQILDGFLIDQETIVTNILQGISSVDLTRNPFHVKVILWIKNETDDYYEVSYDVKSVVRNIVAESNIAILRLAKKIIYSDLIQPICLWPHGQSDQRKINRKHGTAVGFVHTQPKPGRLEASQELILDYRTCQKVNSSIPDINLNEDKFCVVLLNKTKTEGPFKLEIGSGFFIEHEGRWHIRGMLDNKQVYESYPTGADFLVYNDITKHTSWIEETRKTLDLVCEIQFFIVLSIIIFYASLTIINRVLSTLIIYDLILFSYLLIAS